MNNDSALVRAKHLAALANAAKDFTLAELANLEVSGGASYTLPTASSTTRGGVKIGAGLQMDGDTLSCTLSGGSNVSDSKIVLSTVSSNVTGAMWFDPDLISFSPAGTEPIILPTLPPAPLVNGSLWLVVDDSMWIDFKIN